MACSDRSRRAGCSNAFYWGSAFLINVPIVVIALLAGVVLLPQSKGPDHTKFDLVGVGLVVSGLVAFLYGIIDGPEHGWFSPEIVTSLLLGVALLGAFVGWESRPPRTDARHPTLPRTALRDPDRGTITVQYFALFGFLFVFSQFLQRSLGYTPLQTAAVQLPIGLLVLVGAPLSSRMVQRFSPRVVVTSGLACTATGFLLVADTIRAQRCPCLSSPRS